MQKPLTISIVTPSFNQRNYIAQTIESVISQEGNFCIDYIIIDAGSTDSSLETIDKYDQLILSGQWPVKCRGLRYRWISEPDRGQAHAINKGWERADGDIIAWINSDDCYSPGAFVKATDVFGRNPSLMMIYGDLHIIDEKGSRVGYWKQKDFDFYSLLYRRIDISQPGSFLRREVTRLVGELDEDLHYVMDLDYWLRLGYVGEIGYVPFTFASYRVHENAKSSSFPERWRDEMLQMFEKFFNEHEHIDRSARNRVIAETYRYVARLFLPFENRRELLRSCLLATMRYPPLLLNSDLYGYWIYAMLGFRLGDRLKKEKRAVFPCTSFPYEDY